jgi:chemotaxis protein CheY-P-specific phosphatase CheC
VNVAVTLKLLGTLKGEMLVLFSQESASILVDILMQRAPRTSALVNVMESSALAEAAHILSSSYLNAVGEFLKYYQSIPLIERINVDKAQRLVDVLIKGFMSENFSCLLPIENHLVIEGIELDVFVLFLLQYDSVQKILAVMGL